MNKLTNFSVRRNYCKTSKNGFTLIELIIVIVILGIIAAIAIPKLLTALQKGKQKAVVEELNEIKGKYSEVLKKIEITPDTIASGLDYKQSLLSTLPFYSPDSKAELNAYTCGDLKNDFEFPVEWINEAIKNGKKDISREDAIILMIGNLNKRIDNISEKTLSKWDIALIMFEIIGFFTVIIAIITFCVSTYSKSKKSQKNLDKIKS